jgi:tetratricopeptide (TPR) repeat protein
MLGAIISLLKNKFMKQFSLNILILFLAFVPLLASGQLMGTDSGNQNEASKLFKQAEKLWKLDKYLESEKLYMKANEIWPDVQAMNRIAKYRIEMGDVKGANTTYDALIEQTALKIGTKSFQVQQVYFLKASVNFKTGDPQEGVLATVGFIESIDEKITMNQSGMATSILTEGVKYAYYNGDKENLERIHKKCLSLENAEVGVFTSEVYLKIINKQYDEAIVQLEDAIKNGAGFMASKIWAKYMIPDAYAAKGDFPKAMEHAQIALKSVLAKEKDFCYIFGLNAINNKDYPEAIRQFTIGIERAYHGFTAKFMCYEKRAEAYALMGDLVQARKDYEASLTYNPNYEAAQDGIAKLEGKIISNRKTDKSPPIISISEPATSRGLEIVSAGNDVMVKGTAKDVGGLKSVTINGQLVFSKEEGDFWGAVSLNEGLNKFIVKATDMAGNSAEHTLEIVKKASPIATTNEVVPVTNKQSANYILLIASQNYDDLSIPSLENPIPDAIKLKLILKNNYNFQPDHISTLFNPIKSDIRKALLSLSENIQPEDNLIIFYAGHGIWVEKEKKGYWLLTEAKRNDSGTWLPNKEVLEMISSIPSRHTLLITDACFSGSVFKTRSIGADAPAAVKEMNEKISRVAITSGNDTEVPDESVFMKYLIKALSENKDKYLTAQKLFVTKIIEAVMTETKTEPRYGTLELAGHVGGDFIFSKK